MLGNLLVCYMGVHENLLRELFFDSIQQVRGLTDIQRAARFFIAIKESFGNNMHSFRVQPKNMAKATDYLSVASKRLEMTVIENQDFEHLIKTYDRPGALFYLDPPYFDAEKYYPDRFQPEDHERLRGALDNIKGKFILSYNECEAVKEMYKGYEMISADREHNLVAKSGGKRYRELIIKNF